MKLIVIISMLYSFPIFAVDNLSVQAGDFSSSRVMSSEILDRTNAASEWHSGLFYDEETNIELRMSRSQRISESNIAVGNSSNQYPIEWVGRARANGSEFVSKGTFQMIFLTTIGYLSCTYDASLYFQFFDEGATMEAEVRYPSWGNLSATGQCLRGPMKSDIIELTLDEE